MPARARAASTGMQHAVPVSVHEGRLVPDTWQGVCVCEHRRAPHRRRRVLHWIGDLEDAG